mmetsp:Transcript_19213/g.44949  ORF Transcript_19213/g.44949 Transcript_19213/m.44949 type:complete len:699 (+) Transcript_19213:109-2205(+)
MNKGLKDQTVRHTRGLFIDGCVRAVMPLKHTDSSLEMESPQGLLHQEVFDAQSPYHQEGHKKWLTRRIDVMASFICRELPSTYKAPPKDNAEFPHVFRRTEIVSLPATEDSMSSHIGNMDALTSTLEDAGYTDLSAVREAVEPAQRKVAIASDELILHRIRDLSKNNGPPHGSLFDAQAKAFRAAKTAHEQPYAAAILDHQRRKPICPRDPRFNTDGTWCSCQPAQMEAFLAARDTYDTRFTEWRREFHAHPEWEFRTHVSEFKQRSWPKWPEVPLSVFLLWPGFFHFYWNILRGSMRIISDWGALSIASHFKFQKVSNDAKHFQHCDRFHAQLYNAVFIGFWWSFCQEKGYLAKAEGLPSASGERDYELGGMSQDVQELAAEFIAWIEHRSEHPCDLPVGAKAGEERHDQQFRFWGLQFLLETGFGYYELRHAVRYGQGSYAAWLCVYFLPFLLQLGKCNYLALMIGFVADIFCRWPAFWADAWRKNWTVSLTGRPYHNVATDHWVETSVACCKRSKPKTWDCLKITSGSMDLLTQVRRSFLERLGLVRRSTHHVDSSWQSARDIATVYFGTAEASPAVPVAYRKMKPLGKHPAPVRQVTVNVMHKGREKLPAHVAKTFGELPTGALEGGARTGDLREATAASYVRAGAMEIDLDEELEVLSAEDPCVVPGAQEQCASEDADEGMFSLGLEEEYDFV